MEVEQITGLLLKNALIV